MPDGFGRHMLAEWALDPSVTYLNHGTVGAPPRRVLDAQQKLRDEIEKQPSRFLLRELVTIGVAKTPPERPLLRVAADQVAEFLGVGGNDLVFVDNATSGVNAVLRSFDFREGDELLIPNHAYGAVRNAAEYAVRVHGARIQTVEFPEPVRSLDSIIEAIDAAITPKTRLIVVDHITADSALVMPVAEIASQCRKRGVAVLVDGAHAPGAIPLNIADLGVDWYAGNLHKWAWSPRSSGILWTNPSRQSSLHHNVISWGLDQGLAAEFDWPGTRDPTPHLCAPVAIAYMRELGLEKVQRYNHELAWHGGREMARAWNAKLDVPEEMIGTMISVAVPESLGSTQDDALAFRETLLFEHNIEVHMYSWKGRMYVRISAQIYNDMNDVEKLINVTVAELKKS
jgi:isopenicillin-N epimerase